VVDQLGAGDEPCTQVVTPLKFGGGHQRGHHAGVVPGGILYVLGQYRRHVGND
jgi:hypothetical protein